MFSYVTLNSVIKKKPVNTIQSNLYYVGEGFDFSIYFLNYQSICMRKEHLNYLIFNLNN